MKKVKIVQSLRADNKRSKKHSKATLSHAQRKKHYKPYRNKHVGLIFVALVLLFISFFQIGVFYQKTQTSRPPITSTVTPSLSQAIPVSSSYGYSFAYDKNLVGVSASQSTPEGVAEVSESDLRLKKPIIFLKASVKNNFDTLRDAAAQLYLQINPDLAALSAAQTRAAGTLSAEQIAADMFPVSSDESFEVKLLTQTNEDLGGTKTVKRVFQHVPRFGAGDVRIYSVQWSGVVNERAFSLHLQGLSGDTSIPSALQTIFDTLSFVSNSGSGVLGLSTAGTIFGLGASQQQKAESDYSVERVSPAVVKIYHATCGSLVAFGQKIGEESCNLSTGSGFFVSSDGYIATNGHVVSFSAEDAFVGLLLENPSALQSFLKDIVGLSDNQIQSLTQNPSLFAALIAEVYELEDGVIKIENESHTYFVALGDEPLEFESSQDIYALRHKVDTDSLVKAKLVDVDYNSKDIYVVQSGNESGFSSSDVALLKAPVEDAPYVKLFDGTVSQNMGITVIGFPSDAENVLIDNTTLSTSITNGVISAIRGTAGGKYTLYQSDADASGGNSGGPALASSGKVLGLVTYRFKNDSQQDAAKSYIRAIEDLRKLAEKNNVSLLQEGNVQLSWETGLSLYANNHYSKAIKEFKTVEAAYPGHRLAATYIANAEQAVSEGKDVKETPVALFAIIGFAIAGLITGVILTVRHHGHHQVYKLSQQAAAGKSPKTVSENVQTS